MHGDSHYFRIDKPLLDRNGSRLEILHARRDLRRQPGQRQHDNDVNWVKATVSPHNPDVFSFEQVIVEPNLQAYTP